MPIGGAEISLYFFSKSSGHGWMVKCTSRLFSRGKEAGYQFYKRYVGPESEFCFVNIKH